MELITALCRYALPVLTFIILIKCFLTLLIGHPVNENYAYIEDVSTGEKLPLNTWETSIGKSKTCDIMLDYDVISRFHSVICRRVDGWYVFDTVSKNGTYVKKARNERPEKVEKDGMMIESGNIICFSNKEYQFTIANDPVMSIGKKKKKAKDVYETPNKAILDTDRTSAGEQNTRYSAQTALISKRTGKIYLLAENTVTVGSGKYCDLKIMNQTVSRMHAVIARGVTGWYIVDKNSTNGTTVNGEVIKGRRELRKNDVIGFSDELFTFNDDYR